MLQSSLFNTSYERQLCKGTRRIRITMKCLPSATSFWRYSLIVVYFIGNHILFITADQFHVVSPGPCLHEGDSFCTRRVANSMCSKDKNECFCKPGFVSIQESYGLTCKTLLTNLKCHVDYDCTDVSDSVCHPGAGFCACPSGTVYAPQSHGCFPLADEDQSVFCQQCRRVNGICYKTSEGTGKSLGAMLSNKQLNTGEYEQLQKRLARLPHGCKCPHNTAMPMAIPKRYAFTEGSVSRQIPNITAFETNVLDRGPNTTLPQWSYCKAILVEIGEFCNGIDLLCRAKNARCAKSQISGYNGIVSSACTCDPGYIPVFQHYLGYHECLKLLPSNHSACSRCTKTGGYCFTADESNQATGNCLCPNHREPARIMEAHVSVAGEMPFFAMQSNPNEENCGQRLAEVSCSSNEVEMCYRPPRDSPYNVLSDYLQNGHSIIFITDLRSGFAYRPDCVLRPVNTNRIPGGNSRNVTVNRPSIWCIHLDWREKQMAPPCGIRVTEYISGQLYTGLMVILTNPAYAANIDKLLFQFTCKMNIDVPQQVSGHFAEQSWSYGLVPPSWDELPWSRLDFTFEVRNRSGHVLGTVLESTPIRLHAKMMDKSGLFNAMQVESCLIAERVPSEGDTMSAEMLITNKGCPTSELKQQLYRSKIQSLWSEQLTLQTNSHFASSTSYETELFHAFHLDNSRMCSTAHNCSFAEPESQWFHYQPPYIEKEETIENLRLLPSEILNPPNQQTLLSHKTDYKVHHVEFQCVFRLCAGKAWCSWPDSCGSDGNYLLEPRITFMPPKVQFISKSLQLNVIQLIARKDERWTGRAAQASACNTPFCYPGLHILLVIALVGILTCTMSSVGFLMARRYRKHFQRAQRAHWGGMSAHHFEVQNYAGENTSQPLSKDFQRIKSAESYSPTYDSIDQSIPYTAQPLFEPRQRKMTSVHRLGLHQNKTEHCACSEVELGCGQALEGISVAPHISAVHAYATIPVRSKYDLNEMSSMLNCGQNIGSEHQGKRLTALSPSTLVFHDAQYVSHDKQHRWSPSVVSNDTTPSWLEMKANSKQMNGMLIHQKWTDRNRISDNAAESVCTVADSEV